MLLDQKRTKFWVRIVAVIMSIGMVGVLIIAGILIVVNSSDTTSAAELRQQEITDARKQAQAKPNDPAGWDALAQALLTDSPAQAVDPARRAVRLTPANYDRLETLAIALDTSGQTDQAITEVQVFTRKHPRNVDGLFLLGQLAEKASKKQLALLSYATVLQLDGGTSINAQEAQAGIDRLNGTSTTSTGGGTTTPTRTTPTTKTTTTPSSTGPVTP